MARAWRWSVAVAVAFTLCVASGCRGLMVQRDDGVLAISGKVIARMVIAVPSFGISEAGFAEIRSTDKIMLSWCGCSAVDLVRVWGTPQMVLQDGDYWVACYRIPMSVTMPGYVHTTSRARAGITGSAYSYGPITAFNAQGTAVERSFTTYQPPMTTTWYVARDFWVRSDGTIIRASWDDGFWTKNQGRTLTTADR